MLAHFFRRGRCFALRLSSQGDFEIALNLEPLGAHCQRPYGGFRTTHSLGAMVARSARSLGEWLRFRRLLEDIKRKCLTGIRGNMLMIEDIPEAIPAQWTRLKVHGAPWMGAFMRTEILITVRGCSRDTTLFFEMGATGPLQRVQYEAGLVSLCIFQWIRVLGAQDHVWHVDPDPDVLASDPKWHLRASES